MGNILPRGADLGGDPLSKSGVFVGTGGSQDQLCLDTQQSFHSGRVWARERLQVLKWRASGRIKGETWAVKCRQKPSPDRLTCAVE